MADNLRMGETRVAAAERDKLVQVADANKEQAIGVRTAERDKAIQVADLEKEQAVGEQEASFQRESQVKDAEREMRVKVAAADATAIEGENLSQAKIAASQAELAVKRAEAYQIGESRKREAEAAVLEIQNRAMAKAALAEAERMEAEKRAELEAPAKAEKARIIVDAEAEAERKRIDAMAQADAIFAKLDARARGQFEILAKKGAGLKEIIGACGGANEAFQIMLLEHLDNLAEASAKAISNIKFDKVIVWDQGDKDGKGGAAGFLSNMANTLPPMLSVMKDIGGVELPESLIKLVEEKNGAQGAKPAEVPTSPLPKADGSDRQDELDQPGM